MTVIVIDKTSCHVELGHPARDHQNEPELQLPPTTEPVQA